MPRFERVGGGVNSGGAGFDAAVAEEDDFDLLFEGVHVGDFGGGDGAAAEEADVGECVEVREGDGMSDHAAHGEAGHGAMGLVGEGSESGVNVGDKVMDEDAIVGAGAEAAAKATATAAAAATAGPTAETAGRACARASTASRAANGAGFHDDNHGL